MRFAPELAGPGRPLPGTPRRPAGSVRRTTTIDVTRPDGPAGRALADARGRDLVTGADTAVTEATAVAFTVGLDPSGIITRIDPTPTSAGPPADVDLDALAGRAVSTGFRRHVAEVAGADAANGGLCHLLLDDLVGAHLVSGIAQQHEETLAGAGPMHEGIYADVDLLFSVQAGICAGWAEDASMLRELRQAGRLPVAVGPEAPDMEGHDPLGWHETDPLVPHSVRRRRRIDLGPATPDGSATVSVHFRDSHVASDGIERVVHEYTAAGVLDVALGVLTELVAEARVLPWQECPRAEASAGRAVGVPLCELRDRVRRELRGVSTCTHLNDVLRSLADLPHLPLPDYPGR